MEMRPPSKNDSKHEAGAPYYGAKLAAIDGKLPDNLWRNWWRLSGKRAGGSDG